MPRSISTTSGRRRAMLASVALLVLAGCGSASPSATSPASSSSTSPGASQDPLSSGPMPTATDGSTASGSPAPTGPPASREPLPTGPVLQPRAHASRVAVPALSIDLPVVSGDLQPPPNYPFCDVAAYVTRFSQPDEPGLTYISAHAQRGMFLPLLEASQRQDGDELLGMTVDVFTDAGIRYRYRIERVVRHAIDYAVVNDIDLAARNLVLQTSEGPYGTTEKLQIVATFVEEAPVALDKATPEPHPRDCRPADADASPSTAP